ncbi:hexokinase [Coniophora puteana RWD-64-598 SS2]|uniref:Phosphotransferase n=1 Tax=Coniophora puteana (strain RWD-64-598) TaxID=741705 RepID=A0A5M3MUN6_CONPW|nr:hexokinase [Coniophora puteana RWD-64-598 SS2]EIW82474.1 hexokinase [Coniophora puteana RWD-64-598 SS2]
MAAIFSDSPTHPLDALKDHFTLHDHQLHAITKTFLSEVSDGLSKYGHPMAMIPTYVKGVPNGSETGTFLALDLGGTNLRVCEVTLHGDKTFSIRQQKYKVSEALKTGEATTLFDYLADSVDAFLTVSPKAESPKIDGFRHTSFNDSDPPAVPLALTFSFPVEQTALDSGFLLTWTKGFSAKNAVGKDVVKLLQDAFDRKHIHVKCVALVNDTVGALLSRAYNTGGCMLGAIFGTGTNGAYVESVSNITKLGKHPTAAAGGMMIVNTEWGGFNNSRSVLPTTPWDNKLDRESINPRFQAFEKFISGMYLGEIARNVVLSFIDAAPKPLLFTGRSTPILNKQWAFDTAVLSEVEEAWTGLGRFSGSSEKDQRQRVRGVLLQRFEFESDDLVSLEDAATVRQICTLVVDRAARMSACAVAAILVQTGRARLGGEGKGELVDSGERIGVGVDGSLVEFYPNFQKKMRDSIRVLVGSEVESRVEIGMAKDGSGAGAALCALIAQKMSEGASLSAGYHNDPPPPTRSRTDDAAYLSSFRLKP